MKELIEKIDEQIRAVTQMIDTRKAGGAETEVFLLTVAYNSLLDIKQLALAEQDRIVNEIQANENNGLEISTELAIKIIKGDG